ncbi:MAG: TIGR03557 family F420-dependent LLM class oxidoreductase [Streptosporangiaceae bacterium]
MKIGYFLACEEYGPEELLRQARMAEEAGFEGLWISDHFHPYPWNAEQGHSPFVWSVIGALRQVTSLPMTTAVTFPTTRIHPAIIAQAAATSAVMLDGRFILGVGSGEALNEHILGDAWPRAAVRLEMLEEAIEVIRLLHTGGVRSHEGKHYQVDNARIWTLPDRPVPIYVSGFGPKSTALAARVGDGFVCVKPDPGVVQRFRAAGGGGKPVQGGLKACYARTEEEGVAIAHRLWANEQLPGELAQVLPTSRHIEQVCTMVPAEATRQAMPCGPEVERHLHALRQYRDAGYDEVYV